MTEQYRASEIEQRADEIVVGWFAAQRISLEASSKFAKEILSPAMADRDGILGITILERMGDSVSPRARALAATYVAELPANTPRERYVALARELLVDPDDHVFSLIMESLLREPVKVDRALNDLAPDIYDAAWPAILARLPSGSAPLDPPAPQ